MNSSNPNQMAVRSAHFFDGRDRDQGAGELAMQPTSGGLTYTGLSVAGAALVNWAGQGAAHAFKPLACCRSASTTSTLRPSSITSVCRRITACCLAVPRFAMSYPRSDLNSGEILRVTLKNTSPKLKNIGIDSCWVGQVDMAADRFRRAGVHRSTYFATGYGRHGVSMSVHIGHVMADVSTHPIAGLMGYMFAENVWLDA